MRKFVAVVALGSLSWSAAAQPPAAVMEAASHGKSPLDKDKERKATRPPVDSMIATLSNHPMLVPAGPAAPPNEPQHLAAAVAPDEDVEKRLRLGTRARSAQVRAGSSRAVPGALCGQGSEALLRNAELAGLCGPESFRLGSSSLP